MTRVLVAVFSLFLFMPGPALADDRADEAAHDAPLLKPIALICLSPASGDRPAEETVLNLQDACPPGHMAFLDVEPSVEYRAEAVTGIPLPLPYDYRSNK